MTQDIIKNIPISLDISAGKRIEGVVNIRLYSKDIETGQFEFKFIDEDKNLITLDETYSVQALVKYKDEEKIYLDDMTIEGDIAKFVFPHNFITKDGTITMYVYITKDNYTSDIATISFPVFVSEIDKDLDPSVVVHYVGKIEQLTEDMKNNIKEKEGLLNDVISDTAIKITEFEQALEDYKDSLPQADSVRADIDEILNQFSVDSQAKLSQYDTDVQQVITDNQAAFNLAEETRKTAETDRVSSESTRKTNETTRISNENARKSAEVIRLASEVDRVSAESVRVANEEDRQSGYTAMQGQLDGKADKLSVYIADPFYSPKYTPVVENGYRDNLAIGQSVLGIPMASGHVWENVTGDRNLLLGDSGFIVSDAADDIPQSFLIKDFLIDFHTLKVRLINRSGTHWIRRIYLKYIDENNWIGVRHNYSTTSIALESCINGVTTVVASYSGASVKKDLHQKYLTDIKITYRENHQNIGVPRLIYVTVNGYRAIEYQLTQDEFDLFDKPTKVGLSISGLTEIIGFVVERGS